MDSAAELQRRLPGDALLAGHNGLYFEVYLERPVLRIRILRDRSGFAAVEDATFLNLGGIPAISYGPGDLRVAHADDEHCEIDEVLTACRTYAVLAMEWCGVVGG